MSINHHHVHLRRRMYGRLRYHLIIGFAMIGLLVSVGTLGYHFLEGLPWVDSFLGASLILSGMGAYHELSSNAGKLFAAFYALFSGFVFILSVGIIFAPVAHWIFKHYNLDDEQL